MELTEKEKTIIKGITIGTNNEIITNPYSKVEVELCPEAVAIYDIAKGCEISLSLSHFKNDEERDELETLFYTARDIFMKNWPKEYILLMD